MVHIIVPFQLTFTKILAPDLLDAFSSWPPILILLTLMGWIYVISLFTYHYVEKPGRSYIRKRFTRRIQTTEKYADAYT
jgi:peptidoglycan/LPS O-acetylase OafA/YrhL